jgi:hypothetical protein
MTNARSHCSGMSRLGVLLVILFLAAGVFVGYQVFPFFYYYYELEGLMEAQADKATVFSDAEIRQNLMEKIKKLEIPIDDPEDLLINRFDGKITIDLQYEEVLFADFGEKTYDLYVFKFHPHVERPVGKSR